MADNAGGEGAAADAAVEQDDTYAAKLRKDQATEKKLNIEAGERAVATAEAQLKTAKDELVKIKKENS